MAVQAVMMFGNNPQIDWYNDLEQSSGSPNDEIAVAQPVWMDIDGSGAPELLVAYGRTLWAWDGDTGTQAAINNNWNNEMKLSIEPGLHHLCRC